ncbi:MAG: sulfurtransferase complex subunit TusD [Colwelliaceae bacterium]|nr:sulfurtransferase complex subunit TusD [Colwelliaceae bacterium]
MKKLAIIVTTPPSSHLTQTTYQVIHNAISQKVELVGVFFYQSGVLNASKYLTVPNDEFPLQKKWQALKNQYDIPLYLCSTAAEKYGLIDNDNPTNTDLIHCEFIISGLGELVKLSLEADKVVQL